MPGDVEYGQFKPDLVPRELQSIIDKITTGGYKRSQYAAMGQAANSIVDLQNKRLGIAGELNKTGMTETGLSSRLGLDTGNKLQIKGMEIAQANRKSLFPTVGTTPAAAGGVGGTAGVNQPAAGTAAASDDNFWNDVF